jgi:hypothetical protein
MHRTNCSRFVKRFTCTRVAYPAPFYNNPGNPASGKSAGNPKPEIRNPNRQTTNKDFRARSQSLTPSLALCVPCALCSNSFAPVPLFRFGPRASDFGFRILSWAYVATMFTNRPGITIFFLIVFPAMNCCTFSEASAALSRSL